MLSVKNLELLLDRSTDDTGDQNVICSITDLKGIITYANKKFCEISGYHENELIGSNHNIINSSYHNRDFFKHMWRTIGNGKIWQGEVRNKSKDGTYYWVDTIIIPIINDKGKTHHYFSIRTLINEKKEAEAKKERQAQELSLLLHQVSHQLRQPITQILSITNLLHEKPANKEDFEKLITYLKSSASLLDNYSRILTRDLEIIKNNYN